MTHIAMTYHAAPDDVAEALLPCIDQPLIVVQIVNGLGGIWTDYQSEYEWIRVGRPQRYDAEPYFDYLRPQKKIKTAFSLMLERTLYIRKCHHLHLCEPELLMAAKHAIGKLDVKTGWGRSHRRPFWTTHRYIQQSVQALPLPKRSDSL